MKDNARVHVISLGCPKNTVDSERMLGLLGGNDYEITADPEDADVVIVNTCGFIEPAKEESIETIREASRRKERGRCKAVVVTGCLSTRYEKELKQEMSGDADLILTLREERDIVRHVDQLLGRTRGHYVDTVPRTSLTPTHWAYLRISDGCDHKCAFCAIPTIRGRHVSESMEDLVAEAQRLAANGVRELVLVAQDSVRYGVDLYGKAQLVPLLEELAAVDGIDWMRLMYTYPAFWTEPMIEFYAGNPKMCKYVDMPLQHIAAPVLIRRRRKRWTCSTPCASACREAASGPRLSSGSQVSRMTTSRSCCISSRRLDSTTLPVFCIPTRRAHRRLRWMASCLRMSCASGIGASPNYRRGFRGRSITPWSARYRRCGSTLSTRQRTR